MAEGRLGGEFFTPYSIVRLIVEIIEPFHGRVFDPACGSGGMFVQCAKFVERHAGSATRELSVYGQEQKEVTVPLAKMNLALHGLSGDIRLGNSYYAVTRWAWWSISPGRGRAAAGGPGTGCPGSWAGVRQTG